MNTPITYLDKIEMSHHKPQYTVTHTFNISLPTPFCMQPISADKS